MLTPERDARSWLDLLGTGFFRALATAKAGGDESK